MTDESLEMNREQIDGFLEAPRHAIAAALRADGMPLLSPIWYLYEKDRLYFSMFARSARCRQLRRDPRISLCIDGAHPDARYVTIYGTVELVEDESPWRDEIEWRILRRYHDSDEDARRYAASIEGLGQGVLAVVSPERIIGRDYN